MKLLSTTVSLLLGIVTGMVLLAAVSSLLPSLFVNLGLYGTLLNIVCATVVTIPWLRRSASQSSADKPSIGSMLFRGFALAVAFRVVLEVALAVLGAPNPEQMTWGNQVVIAGGRRTPEGWVLLVRGCIESGLASLLLCGSVAIVAELIERLRRPRVA